jgi:threonine/homoserine/homoserine lactone efflux protein
MFLWIPFLSYIFITAYTPGPNNIMAMNNAARVGFKKGMSFVLGMFAGFSAVMLLCMIFSAVLFKVIPKIQFQMKIIGAAYMLYLIVKTLLPQKAHEVRSNNGGFLIGALLQFINPKIIIYGITAMSSYILPHYSSVPTLIIFAFLLSSVGFSGSLCWALFGSAFNMLFSKYGKALNIIMAALLLYCAVSLFL